MHFNILTIFPQMFPGPLGGSLAGKALEKKIWSLKTYDIREFATDKHQTVDDKPFGGGNGMLMRPDVVGNAVEAVKKDDPGTKIIYTSPRGELFNQQKALDFSREKTISILCGRYEGIDQRVIDEYGIEEVSLGDFILSGGEIAAITIIDACLRLINGVIEKPSAHTEESFGGEGGYQHLLEYSQYTRPVEWRNRKVPEVLVSGNHKKTEDWRLKRAENITRERRKDLWEKYLNTKKLEK